MKKFRKKLKKNKVIIDIYIHKCVCTNINGIYIFCYIDFKTYDIVNYLIARVSSSTKVFNIEDISIYFKIKYVFTYVNTNLIKLTFFKKHLTI